MGPEKERPKPDIFISHYPLTLACVKFAALRPNVGLKVWDCASRMQNDTEGRVISGLLSVIASTGEHFLGSIPTDKNLSVHILIGDLSVPSVALEMNDLGLCFLQR